MNDRIFTTALYSFSALLQADAAILGLGAIFLVYKLQTLDSSFTSALENLSVLKTNQQSWKTLIGPSTKEEKLVLLINYRSDATLVFLRIAMFTEEVKQLVFWIAAPVIVFLFIHCGSVGLMLWSSPYQNAILTETTSFWAILSFSVLVLSTGLAAGIITSLEPNQYGLAKRQKYVQPPSPEHIDKLFPRSHSAIYSFRLQGIKCRVIFYNLGTEGFSLSFSTSETNDLLAYNSKKSVNRVPIEEIKKIWTAFLSDPKSFLS